MTLQDKLDMARLNEFVCSTIKICEFRTVKRRLGMMPLVETVKTKRYLHRYRRAIRRLEIQLQNSQ